METRQELMEFCRKELKLEGEELIELVEEQLAFIRETQAFNEWVEEKDAHKAYIKGQEYDRLEAEGRALTEKVTLRRSLLAEECRVRADRERLKAETKAERAHLAVEVNSAESIERKGRTKLWYKIKFDSGTERVYHINMLKKFNSRD